MPIDKARSNGRDVADCLRKIPSIQDQIQPSFYPFRRHRLELLIYLFTINRYSSMAVFESYEEDKQGIGRWSQDLPSD